MQADSYDQQIEQLQQQIRQLESQKEQQQRKAAALEQAKNELNELQTKYALTDSELMAVQVEQVVAWMKQQAQDDLKSEAFSEVLRLAAEILKKEGRPRRKLAKATGPKLAVGSYLNPHTAEDVSKIKRSPRQLEQWVAQYGFEVVQGWKQ